MRSKQVVDNKHEFAIYYGALAHVTAEINQKFVVYDAEIVHRITHVVRLQKDDTCVFFDATHHMRVTIVAITKKSIDMLVVHSAANNRLSPELTVWMPLLKREALETAVDIATQMGATTIALTITAKGRQQIQEKDLQRLQKIAIAAAEQCKQFAIPNIVAPALLAQRVTNLSSKDPIFFCDPTGMPMRQLMQEALQRDEHIILIVGPEGDLTQQEKELLRKAPVHFMALTPTILRAEQAIGLAVGMIRCLYVQ